MAIGNCFEETEESEETPLTFSPKSVVIFMLGLVVIRTLVLILT